MQRIVLAALLAWACASPAAAEQMFYATAAVPNRVDGFCLGPNGGLESPPVVLKDTVENPRRLLLPNQPSGSAGNVLYVAGRHNVESFEIKMNGGLESTGKTRRLDNANPLDIAVDPARTRLYVPHRSTGRIEAYPLDVDTGAILGGDMTSCALTRADVTIQDLHVGTASGTNVLYVSEATSPFVGGKKGRIDVFQLDANGDLPDLYDEFEDPEGARRCGNSEATTTTTSTSTSSTSLTTLTTTVSTTSTSTTVDTRFTETLSTRKKMRGPSSFVLSGEDEAWGQYLYVYDVFARRILAFQLTGGLFTSDDQMRASATSEVGRFLDLVGSPTTPAFPVTLFGSAEVQGRARAFALKPDDDGNPTKLPQVPQRETKQIIESTPVRIAVGTADSGNLVLYVPGGEANRIHAYRVKQGNKGLFPEAKAFSQTEKRKGTFPNDGVVAELMGVCPR